MRDQLGTPFQGILAGATTSRIGTSTTFVVLPLLVLDITGSALMMASIFALEMIVYIVGGFFTGAIVDRTIRKHAMVSADIARGLAIGTIILLYFLAPFLIIWLVAVLVIVMSVSDMFFDPASFALLPKTVTPDRLDTANALVSSATTAASIIGALVGAVSFALFGAVVALSLAFVAFIISTITIIVLVNVNERDCLDSAKNHVHQGIMDDIIESLKFIRGRTFLVALILIGILMNFFSCTISIFLPLFSEFSFELMGISYGILIVSMEIGAIAGGAVLALRTMKRSLMFSAGIAGEGAGMFLLGLAGPLILNAQEFIGLIISGMFCFIIGFSMILLNVPITSWLQVTVPDRLRGKVRMVQNSLLTLPMPISFVLFGYLAETISIYFLLGVTGSITMAIGLGAFMIMDPISRTSAQ